MKPTFVLSALAGFWLVPFVAQADLGSRELHPNPSTAQGVPSADEDEQDVVVDVTTAVSELPVLVVVAATDSDRALAELVRMQIELIGLFAAPSMDSLKLAPGLPSRKAWPPLAQAAVVVGREPREGSTFSVAKSATYPKTVPDEVRRREWIEYPGSAESTASVLADAILEDVVGVRSHMSGHLLVTDASTQGERSVRMLSPDGRRGRRISGFDSLARGADFGPGGLVTFAAEDRSGKLALFREGQIEPVSLRIPGYVQGISWSPDARHVAVSIGQGNVVQTWSGLSLDQLKAIDAASGLTALSPSINDAGEVLHVVGSASGPFSVLYGSKVVTFGQWAAMPSFCSTATEPRAVYMVRSGSHWDVRITSLTTGGTRTVMANAMAPTCSPDGRTIAAWSPGRNGKGPGIYLVGDQGGISHKVWNGKAAGLRWGPGERLPRAIVEKLNPAATTAPAQTTPTRAEPSQSATATQERDHASSDPRLP